MSLHQLGWNAFFKTSFDRIEEKDKKIEPARVLCGYREQYRTGFDGGECLASISGKFRYQAAQTGDFPVAGDWVAVTVEETGAQAVIHRLLPRKTCFSRKAAGTGIDEQVLSANVDTGFIVTDFGYDFNVRRIERYLTLVYESGARPVIVLNKADMCGERSPFLAAVESVAFGVPVVVLSTVSGAGFDSLSGFLSEGKTAAFLGSSGVGKSSIINRLAGCDLMATGNTRSMGKGRHTTSRRELFVLDAIGIVIDNPGMREIQLWADEDSADDTFPDIARLAAGCRFRDCTHSHEPGCAVLAAVRNGTIDEKRYKSFMKQKQELRRISKYAGLSKQEAHKKRKANDKKLAKLIRHMKKKDE
ncbi:MAG: ribosome small subunit-dependent GTPase A [Spirochaetales bacterium]|nr:ribosome small subunit-dependent GTPase A [Spirochaetales bacterium]